MSKVGQWVFEMQEDAYDMTLEQFIRKHGESQACVWHEVQDSIENEPDFMEMDDGA
jgi:phage-related protein